MELMLSLFAQLALMSPYQSRIVFWLKPSPLVSSWGKVTQSGNVLSSQIRLKEHSGKFFCMWVLGRTKVSAEESEFVMVTPLQTLKVTRKIAVLRAAFFQFCFCFVFSGEKKNSGEEQNSGRKIIPDRNFFSGNNLFLAKKIFLAFGS